ncbi:MAG: hypothetical protein KDE19_06365, partial [Caldilineaceae bacterium]|nr:hypothetical protein [Caldilineaceae bacterium]
PWQTAWQTALGGRCTHPLHVSLQRFVCPEAKRLEQLISALHIATATLPPVQLTAVDIRRFYSAFREAHILKCRVQRDEPLQNLDALVRQVVVANGLHPHYRNLAVLVTVLEGIAKPVSPTPDPLPEPMPLFVGSRMVVSRVTGKEVYDVLADWQLHGSQE